MEKRIILIGLILAITGVFILGCIQQKPTATTLIPTKTQSTITTSAFSGLMVDDFESYGSGKELREVWRRGGRASTLGIFYRTKEGQGMKAYSDGVGSIRREFTELNLGGAKKIDYWFWIPKVGKLNPSIALNYHLETDKGSWERACSLNDCVSGGIKNGWNHVQVLLPQMPEGEETRIRALVLEHRLQQGQATDIAYDDIQFTG